LDAEQPAAAVRRQVPARALAPGVTMAELLDDRQGCRGLHQRRLRLMDGAEIAGEADGRGEAWYVISGSGTLAVGDGSAALRPGTAVWLGASQGYRCRADEGLGDLGGDADLGILASTVRAGAAAGPAL
jgi:quercetin dioxygenase-like cupin family protein